MRLIYFGAIVAGARVVWYSHDVAQCVCRCGKLFMRHRATLRRLHARGWTTGCDKCSAPMRVEQRRRTAANAREVLAKRRAA